MTDETRRSPAEPMSDATLSSVVDDDKITFFGIDWGTGGNRDATWTYIRCGRCQHLHGWRTLRPKRCRHCGIKFVFTAAEPPEQSHRSEVG